MTTYDIQRKLRLAKLLNANDFDSIRQELAKGPLVINVPKMVDGQAAPDSLAALSEQTIVATSLSDDFTIQQVLRHYGIERNSVTFGVPADTDEAQQAKNTAMEIAAALPYSGDIRWDENRPDLL